jgi:uncharacterized protein
MLLDLNKLRGPREHVERTLQPSDVGGPDPDYTIVAPVGLTMDVAKLGDDAFEAIGRVQTTLELTCSRCLEPFAVPVDASFELRYVPEPVAGEVPDNEDVEIADADLTTAFYRDGVLDIGELIREQFQLALPMKPLCSAACRGLCALCGTNLNRSECACKPEWQDPRLAALKSLLTRPKEN